MLRGKRALVTGAAGFVGRHLVDALGRTGVRVTALDRDGDSLRTLDVSVEGCAGELTDGSWLGGVIRQATPDLVFHLAAVIGAGTARADHFLLGNVLPTVALLDTLRVAAPHATVLLASSSAVYGDAVDAAPLSEGSPLRPRTAYAASKVCQEMLGIQYWLGYGLRTIRLRTFNLVGPGQSALLFAGAVGRQVVARERKGGGVVRVGTTETRRDFLDVRDAVAAYVALAAHGVPGEAYNICTGRSHSIQECVDILVGLARCPVRVEREPSPRGPNDILEQVGDNSRLVAETGWRPLISVNNSLRDLLEDLRERPIEDT